MILLLAKHYNTNSYGLGKTKLKTYAKTLRLTSAHSQGHTFEMIAEPIAELREKFPKAGANVLCTYLWCNWHLGGS